MQVEQPGQDMIQLVYISKRRADTTEQDVAEIKRRSEVANDRRDISGVLLYTEQYFLQFLEGHYAVVDALYQRIGKDPRHEQVKLLLRKNIAERDFARWKLGVKRILDNDENQDLIALLNMMGQADTVTERQLEWFKLVLK